MTQVHKCKSIATEHLIMRHVPLHNKNWFQTGGNAHYFAQPVNADEFAQAILFAQQNKLPLFVLGSGANCLISDDGFDGLVIQPYLKTISIQKTSNIGGILVTSGAGVTMAQLIDYCLDHNIIGLEEFSGIPGTIGGSVYINLHYFNFLLEQFLVSATIFDSITNSIQTVDKQWFNFGYDYSKLHEKKQFLLDATFKLSKASTSEAAYAQGRSHEIIRHRQARYPHANTCGSFFRNFHDDEVHLSFNGKKMIHAAYYLDKVGAKGALQIGDAKVSYQHANMIINLGNATSTDIINLARTMQEKVYRAFGVVLEPECQLIGFNRYYPLHTKNNISNCNKH